MKIMTIFSGPCHLALNKNIADPEPLVNLHHLAGTLFLTHLAVVWKCFELIWGSLFITHRALDA